MGGRFMQLVTAVSLTCLISCDGDGTGNGQPEQHVLLVSITGNGTGAISTSPAGLACSYSGTTTSGTCSASFENGTMVTLTATPAGGHIFVGWSGACTGTGSCQVTMNQAQTVAASFALPTYQLTVAGSGTGSGNVTSSPGGITCTISGGGVSGTCNAAYTSGTVVTLTPTAGGGHTFAGWSGACTGTGNCQVTMSQARSVVATFAPLYQLTVNGGGTGSGSVTSSPGGISCTITGGSGTCNALYTGGTVVTLTAAPVSGHTFAGWSGACTGTGSCQVTMSQAQTVTAAFALPTYQLTVTSSGTGSGSVTSSPGGITCTISGGSGSGTCSAPYTSGTAVTLTAAAAAGHAFVGWSGACTGTGSCQFTMSQAQTATATFVPRYQLTVTGGGTGSGSVTSSPGGITCTISGGSGSGTCNALFTSGTAVTLTAATAAGHAFVGWSGACTGTGSCQVTMSQAQTATATFMPRYQLTVTGGGTGSGSVASSPGGITCTISGGSGSGTCNAPFNSSTAVTLTAAAAAGHVFVGWSGVCNGTGSCQVTMTQARNVTATFNISQKIAVPAYFPPTSGEWNRLLQEVPPSRVIVINPNNGPGSGYASRINEARTRGALVLGYVYTKYANTRLDSVRNPRGAFDRSVDSVKADIDRYYSLYPNLDGIFLDEVTTNCDSARSYYKPIYDYIHSKRSSATVIVNPGTAVESCYLDVAEIVVTFEGTFSSYQSWSTSRPGWETNANSTRIWHIVHTASLSELPLALTLSRSRSAGYIYVTNLTTAPNVNTFGQLPVYFHDEAVNVRGYGATSP